MQLRSFSLPGVSRSHGVARALGCVALMSACRTDTAGLERREPTANDAEGSAGAAQNPSSPAPSADDPENSPQASDLGAGSLAVLHGLVDGGQLFVCLRDLETGQLLGGDGFESGALEFGGFQRRALNWAVGSSDVEVALFAAASASPGETCESARLAADAAVAAFSRDAGVDGGTEPPPAAARRVGSLTLTRGSLFSGRHYLLVATGCAAPDLLAAPEVCGPPDPLFGLRSELVLVEYGAQLSEGGQYFGLQFLNASRALGPADLSLQLGGPSDLSVPFVSGVSFGVLRPRAVASVEPPLALELRGRGASGIALSQSWADTLRTSTVSPFAPGKNYVLASIGPTLREDGLGVSGPQLVLIPAD